MSPGDLDARLRSEMTRHADPLDDLDTRGALGEVMHRSARRARRRQVAYAVAVAAVTVVAGAVIAALPGGESAPLPTAPPRPTGSYERGVPNGEWQGHWSMTLDDGRVLGLVAPPGVSAERAPTDGASYRVTGQTLTLDAFTNGVCTELPPGTYKWTGVSDGLLLQPLNETCVARREVFAGLWEPSS